MRYQAIVKHEAGTFGGVGGVRSGGLVAGTTQNI
jgi:hypothetical protein